MEPASAPSNAFGKWSDTIQVRTARAELMASFAGACLMPDDAPQAHKEVWQPERQQQQTAEQVGQSEAEDDETMEDMRQKALANMPSFVGGGASAGDNAFAAQAPVKRFGSRAAKRPPGVANPGLVSDLQTLEQRAARFGGRPSERSEPVDAYALNGAVDEEGAPSLSGGALLRFRPGLCCCQSSAGCRLVDSCTYLAGKRADGAPVVGTCELMCPPAERDLRERNGNVRMFERPDPKVLSVSSPELAVKSFARTGVRRQPAARSVL